MKNRNKILSCLIASALIISSEPLTLVKAATVTSTTGSSTSTNNGGNAWGTGMAKINTQGVTATASNVSYVIGSTSTSQTLDIYLPSTGKGPFPVIVAFHGGGFETGDKISGEVNDELVGLTKGYAVVCVNYRLSGEAIFPGAIYDAKAAIRFIRANASKYNLDPNRIAAWGDSAGANIASMLGTSAGISELEDLSMGNADQKSDVQAVVDFYGPINFSTLDSENESSCIASKVSYVLTHNPADSSESKYMGAAIGTIPEKVKESNPTTYISSDDPPFFVENGALDNVVATQQSVDFSNALAKVIGSDKVTYIQLEGAGHGGAQFDSADNLAKVYNFLDKYLKKN